MRKISIFVGTSALGLLLAVVPAATAAGQEQVTAPQPTTEAADAFASAAGEELRAAIARHEADEAESEALERDADALRPGQFLWQPERQADGAIKIVVSLAAQKAYVYRANTLIGVSTVSTGRRGHRTPTGRFTILQKNRRHFSNLYNNAPMPNMQRLTWDGIALHAGVLPGYPASHGCVRLPMEFSRLLFGATSMGGVVHIVAEAPPSARQALVFAEGGVAPVQVADAG